MIIIWIVGILILLILFTVLLNILKNWKTLLNFKLFFSFFITGALLLFLFFTFVAVDSWIVVLSYSVLLISALFFGSFKKTKK